MSIKSWFKSTSPETSAKRQIQFRIVFVSPFFELEVKSCSGHWQTVHAQIGVTHISDPHLTLYPQLRFVSYDAAVSYAKDTLRLVSHPSWLARLLPAPPASYLQSAAKAVQMNFVTTSTQSIAIVEDPIKSESRLAA